MKQRLLIPVVFISLFLGGCGLWNNFTTYFNRYYNAAVAFEEAEIAILEDSQRELFDFKEPKLPSSANTNLNKVIENCSKILQFNKDTDYFDAALFMIGKSYYYQGNYTKSLRKFRELESLSESELALENQLWIARSELQMRRFDEGIRILNNVKDAAQKNEDNDLLFDANLTEVRFLNYREDYSGAVLGVKKLLEVSPSDEMSAELAFEMGKLHMKQNDLENAAASFALVDEYSPSFDIQFESALEYVKIQKQLGKIDESLEILDDLRSEGKFREEIDRVELETANIYYLTEDIDEALSLYTEIDTIYTSTKSAGIASFMRAEIIEKYFGDLDSAEVLFNRVSKTKAPKEYKDKALDKSNIYKSLKQNFNNLSKYSRQYEYSMDSTLFSRDSAAYEEYFIKKDSLAMLLMEMKQLEGSDFDSTLYIMDEEPPFEEKPIKSRLTADSLKSTIVEAKYNLGNLYFSEIEIPDSAYKYYTKIITEDPSSKLYPRALYALGTYYLTFDDKQKADSLFSIVYENYKEDKIVNAAAEKLGLTKIDLEKDPAKDMFIQAEAIYDSNRYDKAISTLKELADKFPESAYAAKSLYTIGFILENDLNRKDSAAVFYDSLSAKYNRSTYAIAVKNKLTFYKSELKKVADSLARINSMRQDSLAADSLGISVAELDSIRTVDQDSVSVADNPESDQLQNISKDDSKEKVDLKDEESSQDSVKAVEKKTARPGRPRKK